MWMQVEHLVEDNSDGKPENYNFSIYYNGAQEAKFQRAAVNKKLIFLLIL